MKAARILVTVGILGTSACSGMDRVDGTWHGTMTSDVGRSVGPQCAQTERAVLIIHDDHIAFSPGEGTTVLRGTINEAKHMTATLTTRGADRRPFTMVFDGRVEGGTVAATFSTPRCRSTVVLTHD